MANNTPFYQVQLVEGTVTTGPVAGDLAIPLHRSAGGGIALPGLHHSAEEQQIFIAGLYTFAKIVENKFPACMGFSYRRRELCKIDVFAFFGHRPGFIGIYLILPYP